jgi:hypothetical protein
MRARFDRMTDRQEFFLALTMVVMVIIVVLAKDLASAILIIALITNFLIISTQLTAIGGKYTSRQATASCRPMNDGRESFSSCGCNDTRKPAYKDDYMLPGEDTREPACGCAREPACGDAREPACKKPYPGAIPLGVYLPDDGDGRVARRGLRHTQTEIPDRYATRRLVATHFADELDDDAKKPWWGRCDE